MGNETHAKFIDLLRGTGTITDEQATDLAARDPDVDDAASIVVARGWASERALAQCVATFERTQVVSLAESAIDLRVLQAFDEADAIGEAVLPLAFDDTTLTLATTTKPTEADLKRWGDRLGRKVVALRAIGCVLQKLIPHAYAAREQGETRLRGRLAAHETTTLTTLRPANAAATIELAGVMNNLGDAFSALRAFARADTSKPLPAPATTATTTQPAEPALKSASTIQSSAFQRSSTGSFAAPRFAAPEAAKPSTTPRTTTGSMRGVGAGDGPAPLRTTTGSMRGVGAGDGHTTPRTTTGSMRGVATLPVVASGIDPAPSSVRAAAPVYFVAVADDVGAALVHALRNDGVCVFEAVDVPHLRALLRTTKPAVVVVDADLPGGDVGDDPAQIVRATPGNGDVPLVVVAARELPVARFSAAHESADAAVVLDGAIDVDLLRAAVAPYLGRAVAVPSRPSTKEFDVGALRGSIAWVRSAGELEAVVARLEAHLASDPWDADAHALRATVLLQLKRPSEALRAWERAATIAPLRGDTWVALATHLDRVGLARKAERAWRRAADVVTDEAMRRRIGERLKT